MVASPPSTHRLGEIHLAFSQDTLSGIRILDFTTRVPGPLCTQVLGDLGADVTKIESAGGDFTRRMQGEFDAVNRNKRSVAIDLSSPGGVAIAHRLAARCDAVVESFRPGVADRLGVGFTDLRKLRGGLVYCSISAFGQQGPKSQSPGHDLNFLALSGALAAPGRWKGEVPARSPIAIADLVTGLYAATAVLAALLSRDPSGPGVHLDCSLSAGALAATAIRPTLHVPDGGRAHLTPSNDVFRTRGGELLSLAIVDDETWGRFATAVEGMDPRCARPAWSHDAGRRADGDAVHDVLTHMFRRRSRATWLDLLHRARVPAEPVLAGRDAISDASARDPGLVDMALGDQAAQVRFPVAVDGAWPDVRRRPPGLGQHTTEVLRELGMTLDEIATLRDNGVVGGTAPAEA